MIKTSLEDAKTLQTQIKGSKVKIMSHRLADRTFFIGVSGPFMFQGRLTEL